jgi:membrane-bound lytic murein transglycosylase D
MENTRMRNGFFRGYLSLWVSLSLIVFVGSYHNALVGGTLDEETPVIMSDMEGLKSMAGDRPWTPPKYELQPDALGYSPDSFGIPAGMESRVSFWVDIYSKYTTDQGLLHDSQYINIVYESVDFSDVMSQADLSLHQKTRARKKRVDEAKRAIRERLARLQKLKNSEGLEGEDLRYWNLFSSVEGNRKFVEAGREGRLRFQLGQKDRFEQGIHYSGKYLEEMEQIFRDEKLPIELTRLPFVESSFNIKARSRVGASGIWQFMRYTGRQYLKMNAFVDERNDPLIATRAAAKLLRFNYNMLESWPLAVTAYNHGPAGVRRLSQKFSTTNIVELIDVRKGRFGFASANFYASFLAALVVEKNAKAFFSNPIWMPTLKTELLKLDRSIFTKNLVEFFSGDEQKAQESNPHLHSSVWRGNRTLREGTSIRIPQGMKDLFVQKSKEYKMQALQKGEKTEQKLEAEYRVERGDTLSEIAHQFNVSVQDILELNDIGNPRLLRPGVKISIPEK